MQQTQAIFLTNSNLIAIFNKSTNTLANIPEDISESIKADTDQDSIYLIDEDSQEVRAFDNELKNSITLDYTQSFLNSQNTIFGLNSYRQAGDHIEDDVKVQLEESKVIVQQLLAENQELRQKVTDLTTQNLEMKQEMESLKQVIEEANQKESHASQSYNRIQEKIRDFFKKQLETINENAQLMQKNMQNDREIAEFKRQIALLKQQLSRQERDLNYQKKSLTRQDSIRLTQESVGGDRPTVYSNNPLYQARKSSLALNDLNSTPRRGDDFFRHQTNTPIANYMSHTARSLTGLIRSTP